MSEDAPRRALSRKAKVRLAEMPRHYNALRHAAEAFGEGFPRTAFDAASRSNDPAELAQVYAVERGFELLVNFVAELVRDTLEQEGLRDPSDPPNSPADFRTLCEAGAISKVQRDQWIKLCRMRNDLQHEYPDVRASTTHTAVVALLAEVGPFMGSFRAWLRGADST